MREGSHHEMNMSLDGVIFCNLNVKIIGQKLNLSQPCNNADCLDHYSEQFCSVCHI
jgi:hypothetical protein